METNPPNQDIEAINARIKELSEKAGSLRLQITTPPNDVSVQQIEADLNAVLLEIAELETIKFNLNS